MTFTDLVIILFILALLAYAIYDQFIMPRRNGPVLLAIPLPVSYTHLTLPTIRLV